VGGFALLVAVIVSALTAPVAVNDVALMLPVVVTAPPAASTPLRPRLPVETYIANLIESRLFFFVMCDAFY
jgi:hypothetical protein